MQWAGAIAADLSRLVPVKVPGEQRLQADCHGSVVKVLFQAALRATTAVWPWRIDSVAGLVQSFRAA